MKQLIFSIVAMVSLVLVQSCANEPSCKLVGKWKVENCDIQSPKLSPTVVNMAKDEYLSNTYEFQPEGKFAIHRQSDVKITINGSYTFDDATQTLSWETENANGTKGSESFQVSSCTETTLSLTQRLPNDPAKEEIATVSLTLSKVQ